eukprot:1193270-Prorocentrum_minimum.AAC.4
MTTARVGSGFSPASAPALSSAEGVKEPAISRSIPSGDVVVGRHSCYRSSVGATLLDAPPGGALEGLLGVGNSKSASSSTFTSVRLLSCIACDFSRNCTASAEHTQTHTHTHKRTRARVIAGDKRAYSRDWNQSQGTREHIPGAGTNRRGQESIFQGLEPIAGDKIAYLVIPSDAPETRRKLPTCARCAILSALGEIATLAVHRRHIYPLSGTPESSGVRLTTSRTPRRSRAPKDSS